MIWGVDSSALALLINPAANPPEDPSTGQPVAHARERVEHFTRSLGPSDTLIVPTPVLAEILVKAGDAGPDLLQEICGQARLRIEPFGIRAAIELATITREVSAGGPKRGHGDQPWQKVKFDRQIVAIARVAGADRLYADDHGLVRFARSAGLDVSSTWELPVPEVEGDLLTPLEDETQPPQRTPRALDLSSHPED